MPWGKLDGSFSTSPKITRAGNAAVGCYARAISHCAEHLTDGFVAAHTARLLGTHKEHEQLTKVGLWFPVKEGDSHTVTDRRDSGRRSLPDVTVVFGEDGWFIRDFLHYHSTKDEYEKTRSKRDGSSNGHAH